MKEPRVKVFHSKRLYPIAAKAGASIKTPITSEAGSTKRLIHK
jgi:hypothetical protein